MTIEVTPEAAEILERSLQLGNVDPSSGGVRLRAATGLGGGIDVQVELAEGPCEGEETIEQHGIRVFVDPEVTRVYPNALVTVEPQHEIIVVRPLVH